MLTLWDQNFREWTQGMPLCLKKRDMDYLTAAIWNDSLFLSRYGTMVSNIAYREFSCCCVVRATFPRVVE